MEEFFVAAVFIAIPWMLLHYITKWKTGATITPDDEDLLEELYQLARRLDERMETVERLVSIDHPEFKQARLRDEREIETRTLSELDRLLAERETRK